MNKLSCLLTITTLAILLPPPAILPDSSSFDKFLKCLPLHSQSSIPIYTPNHPSFTSILLSRASNRRHTTPTTPKPLAIVAVDHPSHVQATILCAKSNAIQIRIRSGGHDYEGLSYVSHVPFVVLDVFNLRSIHIDVANETAWVEAGATIGELYYSIASKSDVFGFPGGVWVTLGTGGHISGGGYGHMMRKYGLSVDNVIDANLVDVNGRILDRKSMGEDLFWAIRGGGAASFGVVLSWKVKLVHVPPKVTVFKVKKTLEEGVTDVVYKWQLVASEVDEDLFIRVMPQVKTTQDGQHKNIHVTFIGQFLGRIDRLLRIMNESLPELGLQRSNCTETSWVDSTIFWAGYPIGSPRDVLLTKIKQPGNFFKSKSDYVKEPIPKSGIESIWKVMMEGEEFLMQWNPYGGKMHEISPLETPFPHRAGNLFLIQYWTFWEKEGIEESNRRMNFSRWFYEFMGRYVSRSPREAFLNYRDLDIGANTCNATSMEIGETYGSKYFKDNFERLVKVKSMVDPSNFFKYEQSIPPRPNNLLPQPHSSFSAWPVATYAAAIKHQPTISLFYFLLYYIFFFY